MMLIQTPVSRCGLLAVVAAASLFSNAIYAQSSPDIWLERMTEVVSSADYEGTVIRLQNGNADTLKIAHRIVDGVVNEKLIALEGNGLEIIRIGNEVHCILPDKQYVLVEQWNDQSTLFSALPSNFERYGPQYNISVVREDRVAGRATMMLAVRPHDEFRYGHRIWLDIEHAFPLKTELVNVDGDVIEQIKFADIRIGGNLSADILAPTVNIDSFTWVTDPSEYNMVAAATDWISTDLPAGFQQVSTRNERKGDADETITHIVYSDGLADVSVFVAENNAKETLGASRVGTSNSYSVEHAGFHITAVGKVPTPTVRRIATSMTKRQ